LQRRAGHGVTGPGPRLELCLDQAERKADQHPDQHQGE
jgi:hypothetical protein